MHNIYSKVFGLGSKYLFQRANMRYAQGLIRENKFCLTVPRCYFTSSGDLSQIKILQEVEGKIFQVIKSHPKCQNQKIYRQTVFKDIGLDSLETVQLVVSMEQYFGFDITNEEAESINSVESAINIFFKHMNSHVQNKLEVKIKQKDDISAR